MNQNKRKRQSSEPTGNQSKIYYLRGVLILHINWIKDCLTVRLIMQYIYSCYTYTYNF